jgi:hypothetical protein
MDALRAARTSGGDKVLAADREIRADWEQTSG